MLGVMFSGRHSITRQNDGSIFIDRDGTYFRIILNYLRGTITSRDQLPDDKFLLSDLLAEVNYYQLQGLKEIIKPNSKKPCEITTKEEIFESLEITHQCRQTSKDLSFRKSILDDVCFDNIKIRHSLDFSDASLVNTTFNDCYFFRNCQYSFDRTDLRGLEFENCYVQTKSGGFEPWSKSAVHLIRKGQITFNDAINIGLSKLDFKIREVIRSNYDCL